MLDKKKKQQQNRNLQRGAAGGRRTYSAVAAVGAAALFPDVLTDVFTCVFTDVMFKNGYKIKNGGTVTKIVRQKIIKNLSFLKVSVQTDFRFELAVFFYIG